MRKVFLLCIFLTAIDNVSIRAQGTVTAVVDVKGNPRAWINNIAVLSKYEFLMSGLYLRGVFIGEDTLSAKFSNSFLSYVAQDGVRTTREMTGSINKVLLHEKSVFLTGFRGETGFKNQVLSKLNSAHDIQWEYTMTLVDTLPGSMLEIRDVCFGRDGSIYVLYQLVNAKGMVQVSKDSIKTFADLLVKFDQQGKMIASRKLSDRDNMYYRLRMYNDKICVSGRSHLIFDTDLNETPTNEEIMQATKFPMWSKNNLYRIKETGSRPNRIYNIEKYTPKNKRVVSRELFHDTVRFQHAIHQYELLDYTKKEIIAVYVSRSIGKASTLNAKDIHVVIINKRDLSVSRQFILHTERLIIESLEKAVFVVQGKDLLIAHEYQSQCQTGNLTFEDKNGEESFFVVRMSLE